MLDLAGGTTVYLSCGVTDLRKSYNGLAAIIKLKFHLDPYSRCMFAFCNRRRTSIKILQWDGSGFWILLKRLDRNAFHWFGRVPWVLKPHPFPKSHIIYSPFCFSCLPYITQQCYNIDIFLPRRTKYAVNQSAYEIFEKPSSDFC